MYITLHNTINSSVQLQAAEKTLKHSVSLNSGIVAQSLTNSSTTGGVNVHVNGVNNVSAECMRHVMLPADKV